MHDESVNVSRIFINLSVPSVIFAAEEEMPAEEEMAAEEEAPPTPWYDTGVVWYGSLRGGVQFGGDKDDARFGTLSSFWGVKGSTEISEGLTGHYNFQSKITNNEGNATGQKAGNLALVGISGGFGGLTLGKQNNAAYNHSGAIRDIGNWESHGDTNGSKTANSLSYWFTSDVVSMQVSTVLDAGRDTGSAIDQSEFGMTVGLGDIGSVAIGYEKTKDAMTNLDLDGDPIMVMAYGELAFSNGKVTGQEDLVWRYAGTGDIAMVKNVKMKSDYMIVDVISNESGGAEIRRDEDDGKLYGDGCTVVSDTCKSRKVLVEVGSETPGDKGTTTVGEYDPYNDEDNPEMTYTKVPPSATIYTATGLRTDYGHESTHVSAAFGLAGVTVALGHTSTESNDPMKSSKKKIDFLGASGGIGDTGLSWNAWGRSVEGHDGKETNPWAVGLAKSLGGGALTYVEHGNADDGNDGTTTVALRVDF